MFRNYLKIAWRNLIKRKVFTTINVLGLAIGFGSAILIYLFLSFHLSFDNFHKNSDNVYRLNTEIHRDDIGYRASVPPGFAKVFREDYDYADRVAKIVNRDGLVLSLDKNGVHTKYKKDIAYTEADFFNIFNFPLLNGGNTIAISEPNTAVMTEKMALAIFGKTDIVGETFVLENDKSITVTGVLKNLPKATFLTTEIFISFENLIDNFEFAAGESWGGTTGNLQCFTLLKPNQDIANIEEVLTELPKIHRPDSKSKHVYKLQPLAEVHLNTNYGGLNPNFLIIFGVIGLFLIGIACINFINISTAQAFYRSKEIGIRKVLGGFKQHLFWQFLVETFLISLAAVALGVVMAGLFLPAMNSLFELQLSMGSLLNYTFFGFLVVLLSLVSFLSGSYPGILMSRIVPVLALKGKLSHKNTGGTSTRKVLVAAQFVISIALIVATLVISKQIDYAVNSDLGFDKESIVMLNIPADIEPIQFAGLKERLKSIPGVQNVSACLGSPGGSENDWGTSVRYNNNPEDEEFSIQAKVADVDYLKTFGIPLAAGRNFFKSDSISEVLVNEKFAKKIGAESVEEVLGKQLAVNGGTMKATIVGVVKDFHDRGFTEEVNPIFILDNPNWYGEIGIKINHVNTNNTLEQIDSEWSRTFSNFVFDYWFLDESVAQIYETEQRYLSLSKAFSALAIFIGCLGLYGLILFFVGQRTKEIGIRKVLGSKTADILRLFSMDFLKLILLAGMVATPITWYFMEQWLQGYAYRTEVHWWYFVFAIMAIMGVTLVTISYQTLKAAAANPIKSLRTE